MTPTDALYGPGELIAAVPQLLGFTPDESVVAIAVRADSTVSTVLRVDRRDCLDPTLAGPLGRSAAAHMERAGASHAFVVSFTRDAVPLTCPAIEALRPALAAVVESVDAWACVNGRYFAPGCARESCCPDGGRAVPALPQLAGPARAHAVSHGLSRLDPAASRPVDEPQRRKTARAGQRWWARRDGDREWRLESLEMWRQALGDARGMALPSEADAGKLVVALRDTRVRDAVLVSLVPGQASAAGRLASHGTDADAADALDAILNVERGRAPAAATCEAFWELAGWLTALSRQAQRAPLLTLCGLMAWWEGDAQEASALVDAAVAVDPDYRLARLLECTLVAGISPGWLRAA